MTARWTVAGAWIVSLCSSRKRGQADPLSLFVFWRTSPRLVLPAANRTVSSGRTTDG